jgi:hypothetical protein
MGTRQIGQSEDPPIIHLLEEDVLRVWKTLGATERDLLELQVLTVWTANPGLQIMRVEVDMGKGPGDLNLCCGKGR